MLLSFAVKVVVCRPVEKSRERLYMVKEVMPEIETDRLA